MSPIVGLIVLTVASGFLGEARGQELLTNPGFETGDLTGWTEGAGAGEGTVVMVSGVGSQPCAVINPATPRSGAFLFSASVQDGATPGTPLIELSQLVDLSSLGSGAVVEARAFLSGASGCGAFASDDTGSLTVEFLASGTPVGSFTTPALDPFVGSWNLLTTGPIVVPGTADALRLTLSCALDPGFASIDIGVDDVSVMVLPDGGPWSDEGCALAGVAGNPLLTATGPLTGGSVNELALSASAPLAPAGLFVSLVDGSTPFKGGILKPVPPVLAPLLLATDAAGEIALSFTWPAGVPSATEIYFQFAIQDVAAVQGVALSNAVKGTTP